MAMTLADLLGTVGVGLLLLAFLLNLGGALRRDRALYPLLNAVGAGLACWAALRLAFLPFVILEGTWTVVALAALGRVALGRRAA